MKRTCPRSHAVSFVKSVRRESHASISARGRPDSSNPLPPREGTSSASTGESRSMRPGGTSAKTAEFRGTWIRRHSSVHRTYGDLRRRMCCSVSETAPAMCSILATGSFRRHSKTSCGPSCDSFMIRPKGVEGAAMSRIATDRSTAVLLTAVGGPASLDEVGPFLLDVRGGRPTSEALVDEFRERYRRIGARSSLLDISRAQAKASAAPVMFFTARSLRKELIDEGDP